MNLKNCQNQCRTKRINYSENIIGYKLFISILFIRTNIKGYNNDIHIILDDSDNSYFYSDLSLIELKWQYIKLERTDNQHDLQSKFSRIQNILLKDKRLNIVNHYNTDVNKIYDQIRNIGHSDYFDTVIAAWRYNDMDITSYLQKMREEICLVTGKKTTLNNDNSELEKLLRNIRKFAAITNEDDYIE